MSPRPLLLIALLSLAGCGAPPLGAMALYDTSPSREDFFALPWPDDRRLTVGADGKRRIDLSGYYNAGGQLGKYLDLIGGAPLDGFGLHAGIFFRFDGPLDPESLPATAAASITADAGAFVVDVSPSSPTHGQRTPVRAHFDGPAGRYAGANRLTLLPEPGFPLREKTTYAAVVTDGVVAADGGPLRRDPRFDGKLLAGLEGALGIPAGRVVVATVFSTQDATSGMKQLRDAVYAQAPAPVAADFKHIGAEKGAKRFDLYHGTFQSPMFQEGTPPYINDGGRLRTGADGKPKVVRLEGLRFALTVPRGAIPATGWPVILYAHGTGGDFEDFVGDGSAGGAALVRDSNDRPVAAFAMISIDQVLHGPRDPSESDPEVTFFNFQNLEAARDNVRQGALDDFQLLRLVEGLKIDKAPGTGLPIRLDKDRIYFKGHSQGGLTGPLFLAFEPKIKAAVLSGAGADLIFALTGKTKPLDITRVVSAVVGEPVDEYHPLLSLLQTFLEPADPGNYGRFFFREVPPGQTPKSIFQPVGIVDNFTPVPTMFAFAAAMGVQPVTPLIAPIPSLPLFPDGTAAAPISRNVAGGEACGVMCEYKVPTAQSGRPAYDGHFVIFRHPQAVAQANLFLATHAKSGVAQLLR